MPQVEFRPLCTKYLTLADIDKFKESIYNGYFFEMFVEDLPMYGYVGETSGDDFLLGDIMEGVK
ncbi:MAG: transmembrane 9 family protein, partial [bacterium]